MPRNAAARGLLPKFDVTPAKSDKQFKRAQELKATFTAKLDNDSYVRLRNLSTRKEVVTGFTDALNHLG